MKGGVHSWGVTNVALFHAINANHAPWLDRFMLALTWAGDHNRFALYVAFIGLVAWWQFARHAARPTTGEWILALATFSLAYLADGLLVTALKSFLDFPRPPSPVCVGQ